MDETTGSDSLFKHGRPANDFDVSQNETNSRLLLDAYKHMDVQLRKDCQAPPLVVGLEWTGRVLAPGVLGSIALGAITRRPTGAAIGAVLGTAYGKDSADQAMKGKEQFCVENNVRNLDKTQK